MASAISMSDIVTLKRIDMESVSRERRRSTGLPVTPRLVSWNVNNERANEYFPNINRTFICDQTYVPGYYAYRRTHRNSINREASWSPYTSERRTPPETLAGHTEELEPEVPLEGEGFSEPLRHPDLKMARPLGLLKREYKHPMSMYESAMNGVFSRYSRHIQAGTPRDPTTPRQYYQNYAPYGVYMYEERPIVAGKEWGSLPALSGFAPTRYSSKAWSNILQRLFSPNVN